MRLLYISNSEVSFDLFRKAVSDLGSKVEYATLGVHSVEVASRGQFDLIVIDEADNSFDSVDVISCIRAIGLRLTILLLVPAWSTQLRLRAQYAGADDQLRKPVSNQELLEKIRALVLKSKASRRSTLTIGELELESNRKDVRVAGQPLHLPTTEYALLEYLLLHKGIPQSKCTLVAEIYGHHTYRSCAVLSGHICRLREKLAVARAPVKLLSLKGFGYVLSEVPRVRTLKGSDIINSPT